MRVERQFLRATVTHRRLSMNKVVLQDNEPACSALNDPFTNDPFKCVWCFMTIKSHCWFPVVFVVAHHLVKDPIIQKNTNELKPSPRGCKIYSGSEDFECLWVERMLMGDFMIII